MPMSISSTISVATVRSYIHVIRKLGCTLDFDKISARYGLTASLLEVPSNRMSSQVIYEVSKELAIQINEPMFGVQVAKLIDIKMMKGFSELLFVARNVKDAMEIFDRYYQIYTEMGAFRIEYSDKICKLVFSPTDPGFITYHQTDSSMISLQAFARILGGEGFIALHLDHACPEGCKEKYEEAFGMPVLFDKSETCFYFNKDWLSYEVSHFEDPSYHRLGMAERRLAKELGNTTLAEQVKFILRKMLVTGDVGIAQMADALGMSLRTFQRRLKANELNFSELLEHARRDLAIEYLSCSDTSVSDISTLVGYSDLSSFLRAFKSWTGVGPGKYRTANIS